MLNLVLQTGVKEYPPVSTPGIYHSPDLGLISLSSDGQNRITIADKNLGATQVYNDGDILSEANCGKYFQWGNNCMFPYDGVLPNTSTTQVDATNYGPGNYYYSDVYITGSYDRSSVANQNLWGGEIGTVEAMQGPCPVGFHIPTGNEWDNLRSLFSALGLDTGLLSANLYLKISPAGIRYNDAREKSSMSRNYRSSDKYYNSAKTYYANAFDITRDTMSVFGVVKTYGLFIRPFKNVSEKPNGSRIVLFQPTA